jgi:hypothetical protein
MDINIFVRFGGVDIGLNRVSAINHHIDDRVPISKAWEGVTILGGD